MTLSLGKFKVLHFDLVKIILLTCIIVVLLKNVFPGFSYLSYLPDLINIVCFFMAIKKIAKSGIKTSFRIPLIFLIGLILFDIAELLIYRTKILLFLWGIRNQYRFIIFFFSTVILCEIEQLNEVHDLLRKLLLINFLVVAIEFMLGYRQDLLSGTFGISIGTNGSANLFLCVCFASLIADFLYSEIKIKNFIMYLAGIMLWAAAAELKYFFIQAVYIVLIAVCVIKKGKKRKIALIGLGVSVGLFGILLFGYLNPYYRDFFTLRNIIWYSKHINLGVGGFGRLSAISKCNDIFFENNIWKKIFGIGLGNAEYSPIAALNSEFYKTYHHYKYDTLFHAMTYIERGWTGLLWYIILFLISIICCIKIKKNVSKKEKILLDKSLLVSMTAFTLMIYDDSLRRASGGFIIFFLLATPFICMRKRY